MSGDGAKMEADWGDKTGRGFLETERDLCRLDSCCPPLHWLTCSSCHWFRGGWRQSPLSRGAPGDSWAKGCGEGSWKRWRG